LFNNKIFREVSLKPLKENTIQEMLSCLTTRYSREYFPLRTPGLKAKYIVNYLVIIFILSCSIGIFLKFRYYKIAFNKVLINIL
jgi:hypothetical protein